MSEAIATAKLLARAKKLEAALRDWRKYHCHTEFCKLSRPCECGFDARAEKVEALTASETKGGELTQCDGEDSYEV